MKAQTAPHGYGTRNVQKTGLLVELRNIANNTPSITAEYAALQESERDVYLNQSLTAPFTLQSKDGRIRHCHTN